MEPYKKYIDDATALLRALIAIPSVSRDEAAAALRGIRQSGQASRRYRELVP